MGTVKVKWFGEEVKAKIDSKLRVRIAKSIMIVGRQAVRKISVPNPDPRLTESKRQRVLPSTSLAAGPTLGFDRLTPGAAAKSYPFRRTGHLRRNIEAGMIEELKGQVGTNVSYGKWLELRANKPYPWLSKAILETLSQIRQILSARIHG